MGMASKASKQSQPKPLKPKQKNAAPITRPVRENIKPKGIISTSSILKKKAMKEVYSKKRSKRERPEPQHELSTEFKDRIEESRNTLLSDSTVEFKRTHTGLIDSLKKLHMEDSNFYDGIEKQIKGLCSPLGGEMVQTNFVHKDGTTSNRDIQFAQRIEAFKAHLEKKEAEIQQLWCDLEKVQKQIVELGIAVLGPELFKDGDVDISSEKKGYRKEMELLHQEHQIWLGEMQKEIDRIGQEATGKMTVADKEISAQQKREQVSFFKRLFADEN